MAGEVGEGSAILGSIALGAISAAVMIGMTLAGNYILKWVKKHTPEKTADDNPLMGAICYLVIGKIWYPGWVNVAYKRKVKKSRFNPYKHETIIGESFDK